MSYFMGIDGGGSGLRAAITTPELNIITQVEGESANPSSIGREESARRIRDVMHAVLAAAKLDASEIDAVGMGIAGAAATHSADWLREIAGEVLPEAVVTPSSDYEIALVGAHGERRGLLLLAGTGSLAFGINGAGESALAGAWGYLLGDEGSGYWLGLEGLRAALRAADGRAAETALLPTLLGVLKLSQPLDVIPWLYQSVNNRAAEVAALAPLVLQLAETDATAGVIIEEAAAELVAAVSAVRRRLNTAKLPLAFTGSVLREPNALSKRVCAGLGLDAIPASKYTPVVGAAILARSMWRMRSSFLL